MANVTETAVFEAGIYQIETTDPVLAGENGIANVQAKQLANRTAYLKTITDEVIEARGDKATLTERLDIIESITGELEETSAVSVQQAVALDWLYRGNKIAFELWRPGYTLIDTADIAIVQGVSGDDSIDVASTETIRTNEYYVVTDDAGTDFLILVTEKLSAQRIRISENLSRNLGAGFISRCSLVRNELHQAAGVIGNIWLSKVVNVEDDATGGAVVVRRTLNSGDARLYFRDATRTSWTEVQWSQRRQGDDIPAGFADYEYVVPFQGEATLRVDIAVEDITILHIVALSEPTGLGGFINPAMAPTTPVMSEPADAATGVTETPTVSIAAYASPGDTAQQSIQFQIATVDTFATVLYDTGYLAAALSHTVPASILAANTTFYVRARVQDAAGLWSNWSTTTSFTTATSYVYIQTPVLVSPANNAIDVVEQPTMQTGAFAVSGGTDTHAASQWQIRTAAGTWDTPHYDSGDSSDLISHVVPAGVLAAGQSIYYMRARHKGTTYGYSGYSPEIKITTKQVYANVIGVCCTATGGDGGTWVHVDQSGATIANPGTTYFNTHPVFGGIQDVTIDSQIMSKVPKFYFKRALISGGTNDGKEAWWISDQPVSGFEIHPAFKNAGSDIDQFYVGKYQASSDGSKLKSVGGVLPVVSIDLTTSQAQAAARNTGGVTGFMLWSMFQWSAIQWLYLVENATMDSQEKTGMGRVSTSSAANVDATDVAQATYRGIVGLWGNVRQWVDGLKTDADGSINLWDRSGNKTWVDTGRKRAAADGTIYPTTFMDGSGTGFNYDDVFIGDTGPTSNANATAPDYQWFGTGEYFPLAGGHWFNALDAGLWYVTCNYSATNAYTNFGARLAKV